MATQNPFHMGNNGGAQNGSSAQHGTAEQWSGTVFSSDIGGRFGMTPPTSPRRRSMSPRTGPRGNFAPRPDRDEDEGERDREREVRRRPPHERAARTDQPLPEGWGGRMLQAENKIRELADAVTQIRKVVEEVNVKAETKIDQMKGFVQEVEGRFTQLERTVPERLHGLDTKHDGIMSIVNDLAKQVADKFQSIDMALKTQTSPQVSTTVPPVPPSFGGPTAQNGPRQQNFNIGSPLTDLPTDAWDAFNRSKRDYVPGGFGAVPMSQPSSAAPPPPVAPNGEVHKPWDARNWSAADMKVAKELKPFNGTHASYKTWANRVKDHFKKKNSDWARVFQELESQRNPISKDMLKMGNMFADGYSFTVDFAWVSNAIWTFVGEHVVDSVYTSRNVLAGGGDNGLELWRALYVRHEGGADQVEIGGMETLHSFPKCDKMEALQFWVGKWQETKDMYGAGISDGHLRSMFINILPPTVQKEVRETPGLITLQSCINHVLGNIGRLNDAQLSKLHMERLKQSLSATQRISPVIDKEETPEPTAAVDKAEDKFQSMINAITDKMEHLCAAVARPKAQAQPKRAASDFAKFGNRCLHCGSDKHRARDCNVKKALLEKNGGSLPAGYKSAFDKWREKQRKSVAALIEDEEDEFSETELGCPVWCLPQCAVRAEPICRTCPCPQHANSFAAIFDEDCYDDDDDGESKILDAIKQISSKVTVGPKLSQKDRKSSSKKPIDKKNIAYLARLVKSGKMNLPDLNLESNDDYEAVWALVDSGAARSCARRRTHFGNTRTDLRPSHVRMATANGEELKSRGCFDVEVFSVEGHRMKQTFEDADVDMPIVAVSELSTNGELGSNVIFGEQEGYVIDLETDATSKFYKRKGVYFMKLYVPKNKPNNMGFVRPGAA